MNGQQGPKRLPIAKRPVILQELYELEMLVDSKQEAFIEDNGYADSRLQALSNSILNLLSIFGMLNQGLKSLSETSMIRSNQTLGETLDDMFKELQIWADGLPKVIKMTRAKYEIVYSGLLALLLKRALENKKTLMHVMEYSVSMNDLLKLHISRTRADYEYLEQTIIEATQKDDNEEILDKSELSQLV